MKPKKKTVAWQPSWVISNDQVELAITQLGGHMAPVTFFHRSRTPIRPYYVSPWQGEGLKIDDPVLVPLRGDFFCMPFGANAEPCCGERHVCHGEPATRRWTCRGLRAEGGVTTLALTMRTKVRPGKVTKRLMLVDGQSIIYCQHVLEGYSGTMPLGHHATLAVPERPGALRVAVSPMRLKMTSPDVVGDPAGRQYQSLAVGKRFADLRRVPLLWKDPAYGDCSSFPMRTGFTDLLGMYNRVGRDPAWTTAVNGDGGYLWFALKDPRVLPATLFWIANRGRHNIPWNGRNRCLGLEDVCGFFAHGLAASCRPNFLSRAGIRTAVSLSPTRSTVVNYIQGVARVPRGFDRVGSATFAPGKVTFTSITGKNASVAVRHQFLRTGEL